MFLDRVLYYRELAEKSAMEQVAMDVRSSVNLRVAELVLNNRFAELGDLAGQNPMDLLVRKPANYLGVLTDASRRPAAPGNWYFDSASKEVVYFIDLGRYFVPDVPGQRRIAWHISLVPGGTGKTDVPQWARFELVKPYHWFNRA